MQKGEISANPFLRGKATQSSKRESSLLRQPHISEAVRAVCKPTLVTHELWKNDSVLDITAAGMDVLVRYVSACILVNLVLGELSSMTVTQWTALWY